MSLDSQEGSAHEAAPVELYVFSRGPQTWRYTSADYDFDPVPLFFPYPLDDLFTSQAIKRGAIGQGAEQSKSALKLTCGLDLPLLDEFRSVPDFGVIALTVIRMHLTDSDQGQGVLFSGRVQAAQFEQEHAILHCEPITVSLKRNGLRRLYSKKCTHVLYGEECGVVPVPIQAFVREANRTSIGLFTAPLVPGELAGGILQNLDGSQRAMIVANEADSLTLIYPLPLSVGQELLLFKGCDHTTQTCVARFNNLPNFGGFPFIPDKNPFDTGVF